MAAFALSLQGCGGNAGAALGLGSRLSGSDSQSSATSPMQASAPRSFPLLSYSKSGYLEDTTVGFHALQIFDQNKNNIITVPEATDSGNLYSAVWGNRQATAIPWQTQNAALTPLLYTPFDTDSDELGHDLTWWQANHPTWILYECDQKTIAYVGGLPEVPLDFSNPAVAAYQAAKLGTYAETNRYKGVAADIVDLTNNTGKPQFGQGGCGVWTDNHTLWVSRFSGQSVDPAWDAAVVSWSAALGSALHKFATPLALAVNMSPAAYAAPVNGQGGDPTVRGIIENVDMVLDEAGYAVWGDYVGKTNFTNLVGWSEFAQSQSKAFMIADDWNKQSGVPTNSQVDYSLATYLMGKEQASAVYIGKNSLYAEQNYYAAYNAPIGHACAPMYAGPGDVYLREYSGGLAIVNVSAKNSYSVTLPKSKYTDVEGGTVKSPLLMTPNTGYVLLSPGECT